MDDRAVMQALDALGLRDDSYRAILLLPLVEVAWADGEVQPQERAEILSYAEGNRLLEGGAAAVVEEWLTERPTDDYFERGRAALVLLAHHKEGFGADIDPAHVDEVVEYCTVVADAAGGLFGRFFQTSEAEKVAMRKIAQHIARLHAEQE
ncbi:MAG: TerB family tellurite resistance protein [Alphaproteobacteria bacterium]|nr:TerB family tellurite resistance protein [Alphaproteobacteria bacterium]